MADITEAVHQQEVADSILDAPIVATLSHEGNFIEAAEGFSDAPEGESQFENPEDYLAQAVFEQEHDAQKLGDDGLAAKLEREGIRPEQREAQKGPTKEEQQEPAQPEAEQPVTFEAIQARFDELDKMIADNGLSDDQSKKGFADELATALGTNVMNSGWNVEALGSFRDRMNLEALRLNEVTQGDLSRLAAMPEHAADALGFDWLRGVGINPQDFPEADRREFANVYLTGLVNINAAVDKFAGRVTDPARLNDPQANMLFVEKAARALGYTGTITQQAANAVANAIAKDVLTFRSRVQAAAQRQQAQPKGTRRNAGPRVPAGLRDGIRGSKAPRWKSNQDIFDGATMDFYHQQHGRL